MVRSNWPGPERTPIRQRVEFIEEHPPVPKWFAIVVDIGSLPGIQCVAPRSSIQKAVAFNLPGVAARRSVKICVAAIPLCSLPEFHHREIPGDHHGNRFLFSWLQYEAHGYCSSQFF